MNHSLYRFLNVETGLDDQIFVWLDLWLAWPEQWLDLWLAWFSPQWLGTCLRLEGYDLRLACDLHMNDLPPPLVYCIRIVGDQPGQPSNHKDNILLSPRRSTPCPYNLRSIFRTTMSVTTPFGLQQWSCYIRVHAEPSVLLFCRYHDLFVKPRLAQSGTSR